MAKVYKVAIIGVGARGGDVYGQLVNNKKDQFDIVALCDLRQERLDRFGEIFGVDKQNRFLDENEFFKEKRADVVIIATPDNCHVRHALKAFEKGYDILCEKPLTCNKEECQKLLAAQKKYGGKALVCHVLRYAPAFMKLHDIISSGEIGRLVAIDALERVGYGHQAHSYVRGNWRNTESAAPMILAKCCHDLDLLQYYANSKCKSISSVGELTYFTSENAPEGAAKRCLDCKYADTCPYSATYAYLKVWKDRGEPEDMWPFNVIATAPNTEEKLVNAIKDGPYGRCVYCFDNNVVDHQITTMTFENGVKASLTMTAFTAFGGRRIYFHGTLGEVVLDEHDNNIKLTKFGCQTVTYSLSDLIEKGYGHGGGDAGLINKLYDMLSGVAASETSLEASVESHLMGIAAEESRLEGGTLHFVHNN